MTHLTTNYLLLSANDCRQLLILLLKHLPPSPLPHSQLLVVLPCHNPSPSYIGNETREAQHVFQSVVGHEHLKALVITSEKYGHDHLKLESSLCEDVHQDHAPSRGRGNEDSMWEPVSAAHYRSPAV